jgi:hypothetical protein
MKRKKRNLTPLPQRSDIKNMGFHECVLGYGYNHLEFDIASVIFQRFKLNKKWYSVDEFWKLAAHVTNKEKFPITIKTIDNENITINDYESIDTVFTKNDYETYTDVYIVEEKLRYNQLYLLNFTCKFVEDDTISIGRGCCFYGLIISSCYYGYKFCENEPNISNGKKIYRRLVSENRLSNNLKLTMSVNCCS